MGHMFHGRRINDVYDTTEAAACQERFEAYERGKIVVYLATVRLGEIIRFREEGFVTAVLATAMSRR